jgi:gliding motility-associated-like protein
MPTGFSPNHDGNNDVLYVKGRGVSSIDLRIFDRNGEKVFTSTDLDNGWDGTYHGLAMNNNVFVYSLEVVFCNGDVQKEHGSITLVR